MENLIILNLNDIHFMERSLLIKWRKVGNKSNFQEIWADDRKNMLKQGGKKTKPAETPKKKSKKAEQEDEEEE
jgi:hypothetical protein